MPAPPDPNTLRVAPLMADIEATVRERLRKRLIARGHAEYTDRELFDAVHAVLARATQDGRLDALLLPDLVDDDTRWRLESTVKFSSHRPVIGPVIVFVKKRVLFPMTRWLFEYSQKNFQRQAHMNRVLIACIEALAIENARLRRDIESRSGPPPR